jgi:hypothetical protein
MRGDKTMTLHKEILTGLLCLMFVMGVVAIGLTPGAMRYWHTGYYDPNWKKEPYIRTRIALGICAGVLGIIAIFFAIH